MDFQPVIQGAADPAEYDLVAILVDQNLYRPGNENNDDVTGKIYRYAEDVQKALPNTKTLLLPVTPEESPKRIFDVLEKLYLEGQQKEADLFLLRGIVLFGEVPLPVIKGTIPFRSVFPYTDLSEPAFLWNEEQRMFTANPAGFTPEADIWHGVIRGKEAEIEGYLDRNHELHEKLRNGEAPYVDTVLYADLLSEQNSVSPFALDSYERSQEYAEEVAYTRYNKHLLQKLQGELAGDINPAARKDDDGDGKIDEDLLDLKDNDGDGRVDEDDGYSERVADSFAGVLSDNLPDVHTKAKIDQLLPEYVRAIARTATTLEERVRASGRWDSSQVDTVPTLITTLDVVSREMLKELNTYLEKEVLDFVQESWQRDVRFTASVETKTLLDTDTVFNRLNGRPAEEIDSAEDCTLVWGSPRLPELVAQGVNSQAVEYNRLYDPASVNQCSPYGGCCINNFQNPERCEPEKAQREVFSWAGNKPDPNAAQSANFRSCQTLEHFQANNDSGTPGQIRTREVSSVVIHDSPRPEQIQNALEHPTAGHIPSDGVRFVNFQAPGGNLQKMEFLNSFDFAPQPEVESPEEIWASFLAFVAAKEDEIETKIIADNLLLFAEYLFLKTQNFGHDTVISPIPDDDFLEKFRAYREGMETFFRSKFPGATTVPELWQSALRSSDPQIRQAATIVFDRHFRFSQNGTEGPEIKNIFDFWDRATTVKLPLNPRNTADVVTLADEAQAGREGNTQTFSFQPVPLPPAEFLRQKTQATANEFLPLLFRWRSLNVHEKHAEAVRLYFDAENSFLPRHHAAGPALAYFRAAGDENALFWQGPEETELDPEWNALLLETAENAELFAEEARTPEDTSNDGDEVGSERQKACAPIEGAEIWEWFPAVQCWLQSLQDFGLTIKRICGIETGQDYRGDNPHRDPRSGELVEPLSRNEPASLRTTLLSTPLASGMEGAIVVDVLDAQGQRTAAGGRIASIFFEGPGELLVGDQNPEILGTQRLVASGSFEIPFRTLNSGTIRFRVEMEGLPSVEVPLPVLAVVRLQVETNIPLFQNGMTLFDVAVSARDAQGKILENFSGSAAIAVSDPSQAFLSDTTVELENGLASFPVAVRGTPVTLTVTMPGAAAGRKVLGENLKLPEKPRALLWVNPPEWIETGSTVQIPLRSVLSSGAISEVLPADLEVGLTGASQHLARLRKEKEVVVIQAGETPGTLHLFAKANGIAPALLEIRLGSKVNFAGTPNALFTQFFGTVSADPDHQNTLAERALFAGKGGAVTGLTAKATLRQPQAIVRADGAVEIPTEGVEVLVTNLKPLTVKIFDPLQIRDLATFAPRFPAAGSLGEYPSTGTAAGLFFENLDSAGVLRSEISADRIELFLEDRPILTVGQDLSFELLDQRFSLEIDSNSAQGGMHLKLLLDHTTEIGRFHLRGATLSLLSAPTAQALPDGGWYLPGAATAEEMPLVPAQNDALSSNADGVGWQDEAIGNLLLASGQSYGEAMKHMSGPLLLTWGDPTLALLPPAVGSNGFDRTVGEEIVASAADFRDLVAGDFNADGRDDLFLQKGEQTAELLENSGNGFFRRIGPLLSSGKGILKTVLQKTASGFARPIVQDSEGRLHFFRNEGEVLSEEENELFAAPVENVASADLDGDKFEDLVIREQNGDIKVFYGAEDGFRSQNSLLLDQVGGKVSADGSADLFISRAGIQGSNLPTQLFPDPRRAPDPSRVDAANFNADDLNTSGDSISAALIPFVSVPSLPQNRIAKEVQDVNGDIVGRGDILTATIRIPAQPARFHLIDSVPENLHYDEHSFSCEGCDEATLVLGPSAEHGAYLQLWDLPAGKEITIRYELQATEVPRVDFVFEHVNEENIPDDRVLDISLLIPGTEAAGVLTFVSRARRAYHLVQRNTDLMEKSNNLNQDQNKNGVPDRFETDADGDKIPDVVNDALDEWNGDRDQDGVPNYWDNLIDFENGLISIPAPGSAWAQQLDMVNNKLDDVLKTVSDSTCQSGSCVASPINMAFLVPGETNVTQALANAAVAVTAAGAKPVSDFANILNLFSGGAMGAQTAALQNRLNSLLGQLAGGEGIQGVDIQDAFPIFGILSVAPYVCTGTACLTPTSELRFYFSPTITGGTAIAICTGPYVQGSPQTNCFAMGLPLLASTGICDQINEAVAEFFAKADAAVSSQTGGQIAFVVDEGKGPRSQAGQIRVKFPQGIIRWNTAAGRNAAPASSPGFFDRWLSAQIDEVKKMFKLPTFTLIYPDLQGSFLDRAQLEKLREKTPPAPVPPATGNAPQLSGAKQQINTAYDKLQPLTTAAATAEKAVGSITGIYNLLKSIPLLDVHEEVIPIAVPHLSRERLFGILDDLAKWKEDAAKELADWRAFVSGWECPPALSNTECQKSKTAWQRMRERVDVDYEKLLFSIEENIRILKEYTDFHNIIAHYDAELAKYIDGIICYIDAVTDLLGNWMRKNLAAVRAWIRFYKTVKIIMKDWRELFKVPDLAIRNCDACTADTYTTGGSIFENFFSVLPTPPVITFPKLPDLVLDISQIKARLRLEVPRLDFYPEEITFPQLPRLQLPRVPTVTLVLPDIPILPEMPPLPRLPDFPDIPIPELPTIPPPPKLPSVSADLTKVIKVARKLMRLYCLFKQGLFVYPESNLRSIVETLTNRPASILLDIDFLNLSFPNIEVPTVDEIRVTAQVNLTLDFAPILGHLKEQVDKWNALVVSKKNALLKAINEKFDFGRILDFHNALPENIDVVLPGDGETGPLRDRRPSEPVDPLEKPEPLDPLGFEIEKTGKELAALLQNEALEDFERIADLLGVPDPVLSPETTSEAVEHLQQISAALTTRRGEVLDEGGSLAESGSLTVLLDPQRPEKLPLPAAFSRVAADTNMIPQNPLIFREEESDSLGILNQDESERGGSPEIVGEYRRQGIFIYDRELGQAQKVVAYEGFDEIVQKLVFRDVDNDGDEDLLILTPDRLLLKRNRTADRSPYFLATPPQVGSFVEFLPAVDAVKNVRIEAGIAAVSIDFEERRDEDLAGVEIILKNAASGFIRPTATVTKYIELLLPEFAGGEPGSDQFLTGARTVTVLGRNITAGKNDAIRVAELRGASFEFPLEEGLWTVRLRFIRRDGQTGTLSEPHLAAPQNDNDSGAPLFVGEQVKKIPVFTKRKITAEGLFDLESGMTFDWDLNSDGKSDANGYEIKVGPFAAPEKKNVLLSARDAGGNRLEVPLILEIFVPDISLEETGLSTERIARGESAPPSAAIPLGLLRQRWQTWKMIRTPSADRNGRYFTAADGKFEIADFNASPDAIVKDNAGKVIARVAGTNGRIFLEQEGYRLQILPGNETYPARTVILAENGAIVASVVFKSGVESDVHLSPEAVQTENMEKFAGVTLFDRNPEDAVNFGGLPVDAPVFPGGAAIFDRNSEEILALVSRQGDVRFLQEGMELSLQAAEDPATAPVIWEIRSPSGPLFEMYVRTAFPQITLHQEEYWTARTEELSISPKISRIAATSFESEEAKLPFSDLDPEDPAYAAVQTLFERDILSGYADGTFRPDQQISRAEFTKIVLGATSCSDCTRPTAFEWDRFFDPFPFPDVKFGEWYAFCVSKAKKLGMVQGYGDGTFGPQRNISRAEAVAILLRAAEVPLTTASENENRSKVRDIPRTAWYAPYLATAIDLGLVSVREGGFVLPEQQISRGEFALMAAKVLELADCREKDTDDDGIPDYQEIAFGLDERNAADATEDSDQDGLDNRAEILNGTDPRGADGTRVSPDSGAGDRGGTTGPADLCPAVPEDQDGIADDDGCPEISGGTSAEREGDPGVDVYRGDPAFCGLLDFLADLRPGDLIKAAIMNPENTKIFSESNTITFSP